MSALRPFGEKPRIIAVQSRVNDLWSYLPESAVALLRPEYDEGMYATKAEALAAAKRRYPRANIEEAA